MVPWSRRIATASLAEGSDRGGGLTQPPLNVLASCFLVLDFGLGVGLGFWLGFSSVPVLDFLLVLSFVFLDRLNTTHAVQ